MLVKFFGQFENQPEIELEAENFQQLLAGLQYRLGAKTMAELSATKVYWLLGKGSDKEDLLVLRPDLQIFNFGCYDTLYIIPEVSGDIPVPLLLIGLLASATGMSTATAGLVLAAIGNMLIATAISAVVQLLSPTPEFKVDPSEAQNNKSSLFNGAEPVLEQGGSVPLIYGEAYCTGVLISSALYNEEEEL